MLKLRENLPPLPPRIARLPLDPERGYPVPWFVQWFAADGKETRDGVGKPDFRVTSSLKMRTAYREKRCWICGDFLGSFLAFVIGPMCAINRITSEPPSHRECAEFAVRACPFLVMPKMIRRDAGKPEGTSPPAGVHLDRNPGVCLIWVTKSFHPFVADHSEAKRGVLFNLGDPVELRWFREGREASRGEVIESIDSGFPLLHEVATRDGEDAVREVETNYRAVIRELVPHE